MNQFLTYGIQIPNVLLPKSGADLKSWSVIACDQFTQDRDYWERCKKLVGNKPSTLNLILPEVYLNDSDKQERIKNIHSKMCDYLKNEVFATEQAQFIYIERKSAYNRVRKGLIVAIDLETYEWKPFSKALIRATEATIVDRIPPRMEIRNGAPLESPHIMLLVNDSEKTLVEKIGEQVSKKEPLYQTDLMENSGSIKGFSVETEDELFAVKEALHKLYKKNTMPDGSVFMFAVGDGNHSLATAKAVWDKLKEENGGTKNPDGTVSVPKSVENHNARYALVEIVNIFDDGLTFEPIHRVLFNINKTALVKELTQKLNAKAEECKSKEELVQKVENSNADFGFVFKDESNNQKYIVLKTQIQGLAVSSFQPALDDVFNAEKNAFAQGECVVAAKEPELDYIHGTDEVFRLGELDNAVSVLLPPIKKESFFSTISAKGPLPRKSFSMGEASEKRFYMECRKLF